jgi:hypothetical protein
VRQESVKGRLLLGAVVAGCALAPIPPSFVEHAYSGGVYPPVQHVLTGVSNRVPFALIDPIALAAIALWILFAWRDARRHSLPRALTRVAVRTVTWLAALYLAFLCAWGLNYRRVPLVDRLQFDAARVSPESARDLARTAVDQVNALHDAAHANPSAAEGIDIQLAAAFARTQRDLGATWSAVPGRPKRTLLDAYFLRAGVDGMTDPFFLETLIASDLLPIERPLIVAHEWAHLAGITDEGEANFAGWLTCLRGTAAHRYSAWLFLFSELTAAVPRADRAAIFVRLDAGPRDDLRAIARRIEQHLNPRVAMAGWQVYDRYLKANRVERGTESYAEVVKLVLGVERDGAGAPLLR